MVAGTTTIAGLESALHGDVLPCVSGITRGIDTSRSHVSGAPGWAQGKWTLKTATGQLYVVDPVIGKLTISQRVVIESSDPLDKPLKPVADGPVTH